MQEKRVANTTANHTDTGGRSMSTLSTRQGIAVLVAAGALLLAALAAAPQAEAATIYACVKKKSGTARIVTKKAKCKKGETKLSWNTNGPAGTNGANGTKGINGINGTNGTNGKEGATGPRGPGIVASANGGQSFECVLASGENFCYEPARAFTPSTNAQCLVSVSSQIFSFAAGTPASSGPYFRIAIKTGATNGNDEEFGYYFEGTDGTESTPQERTKLITVKAGTTYNFGAYYGFPNATWQGKSATFEVTYICFG